MLLLIAGMSLSCSTKKETVISAHDAPNPVAQTIITAPIVKKNFVNKAGKATDHVEYYIRRSIQDYYIKFCESNVSIKELNEKLENIENKILPTKNLCSKGYVICLPSAQCKFW